MSNENKAFDFFTIETDRVLEKEGTWVKIMGGQAQIRVASTSKLEYIQAVQDAAAPYNDMNVEPDPVESAETMSEIVAEHLLLDWKNVAYKGKKLPYNKKNAAMLLNKVDRFYTIVMQEAKKFTNFQKKEIEEAAKNLGNS